MSSKIWVINIVLMAVVAFFSVKAYDVWSEGRKLISESGSIKKPLPWPEKKIPKKRLHPESDYTVIVSNNLFNNDRLERPPQKQEEGKKPEPTGRVSRQALKLAEWSYKNTNLYGVIIVGDHREALIGEVPASAGKGVGERGVKHARVGDTVGRFKVKEIKDTSVLLTAVGREWRVSLFDKDKPKKRALLKKETGPVVIVGGSKTKSVLTDAKAVGKRPTPKPAVSKKKTLPKAQNKKRTIPVPTDRSRTRKR